MTNDMSADVKMTEHWLRAMWGDDYWSRINEINALLDKRAAWALNQTAAEAEAVGLAIKAGCPPSWWTDDAGNLQTPPCLPRLIELARKRS